MDQPATVRVHVDEVGRWIRVSIAGQPDADLVHKVNDQVLALVHAGRGPEVLFDATQMLPPPASIAWLQRDLLWRLEPFVRCAAVVSDARCAFLARIAFGDANYRIFYDDVAAAERWLGEG